MHKSPTHEPAANGGITLLLQSARVVAAVVERGSLDSIDIRQNDSRHHVGSRNRTVLDIASTRSLFNHSELAQRKTVIVFALGKGLAVAGGLQVVHSVCSRQGTNINQGSAHDV